MGIIADGLLGYKDEASYGVSAISVDDATIKALGLHKTPFQQPVAVPAIVTRYKTSSYSPASLTIGRKEVGYNLEYDLLDPREIFYAMGVNVDAGSDPYTHTMTHLNPATGLYPKSRTMRLESTGLTTNKEIEVIGCLTENYNLGWDASKIGIAITETILGQRINDNSSSSPPNSISSFSPNLRSGVTPEAQWYASSLLYNSVEIIDDIGLGNISINNVYEKIWENRSGSDEYGNNINTYMSNAWLSEFRAALSFEAIPTDLTIPIWNNMQDNKIDNALVVTLTKVGGTDTIVFTFDSTYAAISEISGNMKFALDDPNNWLFSFDIKELTNIVATDSNPTLID